MSTRLVETSLSIAKPLDARGVTTVRLHVQDAQASHDYVIVEFTAEQFARLLGGTVIVTPGEVPDTTVGGDVVPDGDDNGERSVHVAEHVAHCSANTCCVEALG